MNEGAGSWVRGEKERSVAGGEGDLKAQQQVCKWRSGTIIYNVEDGGHNQMKERGIGWVGENEDIKESSKI